MFRRLLAALSIATLALTLATATALAGGWAEVKPDSSTITAPGDGGSIVLGFTVLQHGVTPASWVTPIVRMVDLNSGATHDVGATQVGAEGHFVARTPPLTGGYWTWTVSFPELESDQRVNIVAVRAADGTIPSFAAAEAILAVEAASKQVRNDLTDTLYLELDDVRSELALRRAFDDRLTAQVAALTEESGAASSPAVLAGMLLLATLAGGLTAFAIVGLAGRSALREVPVSSEPSPRGSSPA